ncbi:MAG TPA: tetratricopeptide repeat protein [Bryobacteraceae bacterium]|nr:tetratricopeptide repeat protein [Bryobacteraceae bacterium]
MSKLLLCFATVFLLVSTMACRVRPEAITKKADKLFTSGNYAEAELNYKKALQKDSNYGEAHYGLALTELQLLKTREAYDSMSRAADLLPNRPDVKIRLADFALALYLPDPKHPANLYNQLNQLSGDLLAKDPNSFDGLRIKGHLATAENKTADAADFFRKANRVKPNQPEIVLSLSQALFKLKLDGEAEKTAWDLINNKSTFPQIYDLLYKHYLFTGRLADAEKIMRAKVANNPKTARYLTQLAGHFYAFGKRTDMEATLQVIKDHSKEFPDAHILVGDFYTDIGQLDQARREFEQGAKDDPKQAQLFQKRITNLLMVQGQKDAALQEVDKMVAADPKSASLKSVKAGLLLNSGEREKIDAAVQELTEVVKNKPDDPIARYNLGRALMAQGNLALSTGQFEESIKLRPSLIPPRFHLADIGIETRRFDQSLRYANDILALQPNDPEARLRRAMSEQGLDRLKEAREDLNNLIKEQPKFVDAQLQLGFLDIREKRLREATELFQKLYQPGDKNVRPLQALVQALELGGQSDKAIKLLSDELKSAPDSVAIRLDLAATAAKAEKLDLAIDQYQQLASSNPKAAVLQFYLGELYDKKGEKDRALASLQKAVQLDPKDTTIAMRLSSVLDQAGRKEEAIAVYRKLLKLQPDNPMALNNLAFLMADSGNNLEEALKLAEQAKRKMPQQPVVDDTIGWIYLKKGMPQSAMQVFGTLTRQQPANSTYHYHYGLSLLKHGDKQKGEIELRLALASHPSKVEEQQIRQFIASAH